MIGSLFKDRYKVLKRIGEGGMAVVYRGFDQTLNRDVAIKVLKDSSSSSPIILERFKREVLAASEIIHENVVQLYDIVYDNYTHAIIMELIEGQTLKELIREQGALLSQEAVSIIKQICKAAHSAHIKNIVHRDIKPQNIMITNDGTAKLMDFGISIIQNVNTITKTDAIMGSVQYIAPEVVIGEAPSIKSDIYSIGIMFYELLRNKLPFIEDTHIQIAMSHINKEMPKIRRYNKKIPQSIENSIIRATAKKPTDRYNSALDMYKDLTTVFNQERENERPIEIKPITSRNKKSTTSSLILKPTNYEDGRSKAIIIMAIIIAILIVLLIILLSNL